MNYLLQLSFVFISLSTHAAPDWKCSNWSPVVSPIMVHTGARRTLLRLSQPTTDIWKARSDFKRAQGEVASYKKQIKYDLKPVLVKKNNQMQVILSECWTQSEAASLLLKFKNLSGTALIDFRGNSFQEIKDPDCISCN